MEPGPDPVSLDSTFNWQEIQRPEEQARVALRRGGVVLGHGKAHLGGGEVLLGDLGRWFYNAVLCAFVLGGAL